MTDSEIMAAKIDVAIQEVSDVVAEMQHSYDVLGEIVATLNVNWNSRSVDGIALPAKANRKNACSMLVHVLEAYNRKCEVQE